MSPLSPQPLPYHSVTITITIHPSPSSSPSPLGYPFPSPPSPQPPLKLPFLSGDTGEHNHGQREHLSGQLHAVGEDLGPLRVGPAPQRRPRHDAAVRVNKGVNFGVLVCYYMDESVWCG